MGCFNVMGFHTHLPVTCEDDIVLLLGVYPEYENRNVRRDFVDFAPGNDFTPIALPIFGKYNDYGSIEDIERDANVESIEKYFGLDIEKIIDLVDDDMIGRHMNDEDTEVYKQMCEKIYNLQPTDWVKSDFSHKYQIVFIIDHRFIYDTIKNLGASKYNFERSYDAIMDLYPPWEEPVRDIDKIDEAEEKEKRGEITKLECKKIGLIHGWKFDSAHTLWISYLNEGKWYWGGDYLVDFTMPQGYCPSNFWNNDDFDSYSVMGVYRDKENYKTLFTTLKEKYIEFLKFIAEFITHQWCFTYHVYGTQETHCTTALSYYEKMVEFCKQGYEREEEIRRENEDYENEDYENGE
jgi:hypothetical protein